MKPDKLPILFLMMFLFPFFVNSNDHNLAYSRLTYLDFPDCIDHLEMSMGSQFNLIGNKMIYIYDINLNNVHKYSKSYRCLLLMYDTYPMYLVKKRKYKYRIVHNGNSFNYISLIRTTGAGTGKRFPNGRMVDVVD